MAGQFDYAAHAKAMRAQGWWQDKTLDNLLDAAVASYPDKKAVVAYRMDKGFDAPNKVMTYRELSDAVAKAAGSFRALGISKGDVVGLMVPNWWEFVVSAYALARVGAVANPLMHIFRERELRFMLGFADTKAIIIPKVFRGHDFEKMLDGLKPELPKLEHIIVVDGEGERSFDKLIMKSAAAPVSSAEGTPPAPDEMAVLMYTSGTTGEPKGVMHSFNTLVACAKALGSRLGHTSDVIHFGSTPFGHMTGYAAVMVQALYHGNTVVFPDVWEPKAGVEIMAREGATHMAAATPFLADIVRLVGEGAPKPPLRTFLCAGAPIPPVIIENARKLMGLNVSSCWGMTESLGGSLTEPERAADKSVSSDGRPVDGVEVLIADENLQPMPTGKTGRLYFRGAQQFIGYYRKPGLDGRGSEGWFDTGDLAYVDADGYIRIDGRTKDIIIRGGENVPVAEIESILYRHPSITDAAIVGYPDKRMGERGCAFVVVKQGQSFSMDELREWMGQSGAAKQYWPEAVEVIEAMPRTATGKIQKFVLKDKATKHAID
ncbi:AMP-binding protein [Mesorhizobium australicum]|uniref:3-methylmercaptopropionyl-CoA ligase n=1 Tax=Mesorhizobium australicum TaxID=536018 RepID=A0A1X7PRQ1_9HYPH|nr:AMP-binding protein [Mesorhizobium australicum]SMH54554.1 cyclohexanecarboxylate-CoA ligase [Mesorhizobium australicum]